MAKVSGCGVRRLFKHFLEVLFCFQVLILVIAAIFSCVHAESTPPEILRDPSFLQLLSKHYTSIQSPKINLGYGADPSYQNYASYKHRPQEEYTFSATGYESPYPFDSPYAKISRKPQSTGDGYSSQQQQTQTVSLNKAGYL